MADPSYEMLWDCGFCGSRKLLGLTHRFCPNCGAAQKAEGRYFPSDDEKVAVDNHKYFGADRVCAYCGNASSRLAHHCGHCGAPLEEGSDVARRADQLQGHAVASHGAATPKPARRRLWLWAVLAALAIVAALVVVLVFWKTSSGLRVEALGWERTIEIEAFGPMRDAAWCDQLPSGAKDVTRHREARSTRRVQDGEDCQVRKVDRGDGTFMEKRECTPKYREEPVYGEKCRFSVDRWHTVRTERASGGAADVPRFPAVTLARPGSCVGCERAGKQAEIYRVVFKDAEQKEHRCEFDEKRWSAFKPGSRWTGNLRRLVGSLDCDSLAPAS